MKPIEDHEYHIASLQDDVTFARFNETVWYVVPEELRINSDGPSKEYAANWISYSDNEGEFAWEKSPIGKEVEKEILSNRYVPGYWSIHCWSYHVFVFATQKDFEKSLLKITSRHRVVHITSPEGNKFSWKPVLVPITE